MAKIEKLKWPLLIILAIWLIHPIFYQVPVEGFSTQIIDIGINLAQNRLYDTDLLQKFSLEFFTLSKFGAIFEISLLIKYFKIDGFFAMSLLIWLGQLLLLFSSILLVRLWAKVSYFIAFISVLTIPATIENSFFFSDNVIAAGLISFAFLLFYQKNSFLPIFGGLIFGLGILTRTDYLLLTPIIPFIFWERAGFDKKNIIIMLGAAIAALLAWQMPLNIIHINIFEVLKTGREAIKMWDRPFDGIKQINEIQLFFGQSGIILALIGLFILLRNKNYYRLFFLTLPFLLYNLILIGAVWQSRQLLALAPFMVTLVAFGFNYLFNQVPKSQRKPAYYGLWALIIIPLLIPMKAIESDGPRLKNGGQLYSPIIWRNWQNQTHENFETIKKAIIAPTIITKIFITDYWNEDRYLHASLLNENYKIDRLATQNKCPKIAEYFTNGKNNIIHIRLHQSFNINAELLLPQRFEQWAMPCIKGANSDEIYYISNQYDDLILDPPYALSELPIKPQYNLSNKLLENQILLPILNKFPNLKSHFALNMKQTKIIKLDANGLIWLQGRLNNIANLFATYFPNNRPDNIENAHKVTQSRIKLD